MNNPGYQTFSARLAFDRIDSKVIATTMELNYNFLCHSCRRSNLVSPNIDLVNLVCQTKSDSPICNIFLINTCSPFTQAIQSQIIYLNSISQNTI